MAFNDKYEGTDPIKVTETLTHDLSQLGEILVIRTELEDTLIDTLFDSV